MPYTYKSFDRAASTDPCADPCAGIVVTLILYETQRAKTNLEKPDAHVDGFFTRPEFFTEELRTCAKVRLIIVENE